MLIMKDLNGHLLPYVDIINLLALIMIKYIYLQFQVFKDIEDVIIKTCISAQPNMLDIHTKSQERRNCCFQLYGFDILIDSNLKPWLMQVNVCPSLSSSSPMDRKIKHTLITDILNLIGFEYKASKTHKNMKDNFISTQTTSSPFKKIYSKNINNL